MPINIPPSPSASEAPDYAQRLHEVRELANGKKPTRRRRKARVASAEDQRCPTRKTDTSHRCAEDAAVPPVSANTDAARSFKADTPKSATTQAAAQAIQQRMEELNASRLVRFPQRKEQQPKQAAAEDVPFSRVIAASAIVSTAVSLVVTFASQGILSPVATSLIAASGSLSSL